MSISNNLASRLRSVFCTQSVQAELKTILNAVSGNTTQLASLVANQVALATLATAQTALSALAAIQAALSTIKSDLTGQTLANGDGVLSGGFGSTAAVTLTGTDRAFLFSIASAGTGQGASPTLTVTYKTAMAVAPIASVLRGNDANQPTVLLIATTSTTTIVISFRGTPVAGETYTGYVMLRGH